MAFLIADHDGLAYGPRSIAFHHDFGAVGRDHVAELAVDGKAVIEKHAFHQTVLDVRAHLGPHRMEPIGGICHQRVFHCARRSRTGQPAAAQYVVAAASGFKNGGEPIIKHRHVLDRAVGRVVKVHLQRDRHIAARHQPVAVDDVGRLSEVRQMEGPVSEALPFDVVEVARA